MPPVERGRESHDGAGGHPDHRSSETCAFGFERVRAPNAVCPRRGVPWSNAPTHDRPITRASGKVGMTERLVEQTCVPCRGGIPPLSIDAARRFLEQAPSWNLLDDGRQLLRTFWFSNFRESLDFVREVGELAEAERHHPEIAFGWGQATISLRTNKIKGLHQNDFIMAAKIDRLARERGALENRPQKQRSPEAAVTSEQPNDDRGSALANHR